MMHALPSESLKGKYCMHKYCSKPSAKPALLVYASDTDHQNPTLILFRPYRLSRRAE